MKNIESTTEPHVVGAEAQPHTDTPIPVSLAESQPNASNCEPSSFAEYIERYSEMERRKIMSMLDLGISLDFRPGSLLHKSLSDEIASGTLPEIRSVYELLGVALLRTYHEEIGDWGIKQLDDVELLWDAFEFERDAPLRDEWGDNDPGPTERDDQWLDADGAAEHLRMSRRHFLRLCRAGDGPEGCGHGRLKRWRRSVIDAWQEGRIPV